MKKRVFIRCFVIALISVLIVFAAGVGVTYAINRNLISKRLVTETKLAVALLDSAEDLDGLREVFFGDEACRVTVISLDGEVLFESDTYERLENHIDREEIRAAIRGNPRTVERYSETLRSKMTYYAQKCELSDGETVIVRLAVWSTETNSYILAALPFLLLSLIVSAVVAGLFAKKLSKSVAERICEVSKSLKSVSEGEYEPIATSEGDREFCEIYGEINEINEKILQSLQSSEHEKERLAAILEAEKGLARRKEEFFANASHELKTPLTAMVGLSEIIMSKELDESTHRQAERIYKESTRLSFLISDMLKLSRLESETDVEPRISVEVAPIAQEVISELAPAMSEKNVTARLVGNVTVKADEKRIYEILQNLCSNAVNYNKQDGEVEVMLGEKNGKKSISVRDTGIGIAEENIPHLCERFYRVDKSRSKKTGGTGLGLAIVKHICALYGAEVLIESKLGEGTTVTVLFS